MLIALMSDMHGNREAFAACLASAAAYPVDRYVFLGDYVGYGADPVWVLDQVIDYVARGAAAVLGNHDDAIAAPRVQMTRSRSRQSNGRGPSSTPHTGSSSAACR